MLEFRLENNNLVNEFDKKNLGSRDAMSYDQFKKEFEEDMGRFIEKINKQQIAFFQEGLDVLLVWIGKLASWVKQFALLFVPEEERQKLSTYKTEQNEKERPIFDKKSNMFAVFSVLRRTLDNIQSESSTLHSTLTGCIIELRQIQAFEDLPSLHKEVITSLCNSLEQLKAYWITVNIPQGNLPVESSESALPIQEEPSVLLEQQEILRFKALQVTFEEDKQALLDLFEIETKKLMNRMQSGIVESDYKIILFTTDTLLKTCLDGMLSYYQNQPEDLGDFSQTCIEFCKALFEEQYTLLKKAVNEQWKQIQLSQSPEKNELQIVLKPVQECENSLQSNIDLLQTPLTDLQKAWEEAKYTLLKNLLTAGESLKDLKKREQIGEITSNDYLYEKERILKSFKEACNPLLTQYHPDKVDRNNDALQKTATKISERLIAIFKLGKTYLQSEDPTEKKEALRVLREEMAISSTDTIIENQKREIDLWEKLKAVTQELVKEYQEVDEIHHETLNTKKKNNMLLEESNNKRLTIIALQKKLISSSKECISSNKNVIQEMQKMLNQLQKERKDDNNNDPVQKKSWRRSESTLTFFKELYTPQNVERFDPLSKILNE